MTITVYNIQWRKIRILADRLHKAWHYPMTWDGWIETGAAVPGGINIDQIQMAQRILSRKMLLMLLK